MEYPRDFPAHARARIEAKQIRAHRDFEKSRNEVPQSKYGPVAADEKNLRKYILGVFLAFAQETCKLGWGVDRVRSESREFLRRFTIEAYSDDGRDKSGRKLREMTSNWDGSLLPEVNQEFRKSPEWHQFEDRLLTQVNARTSTGVGRQRHGIDRRKELIASLRARNPDAQVRKICGLIDQKIEKEAPILRADFAPLESWTKLVPSERTWVGLYEHSKTHERVRSYINKVPPLKTRRNP